MSLDPSRPAVDGAVTEEEDTSLPYITYATAPNPGPPPGDPTAATDIIVRRPAAGLTPYKNEFSTLEIVAAHGDRRRGTYVDVLNSTYSTGRAPGTANFLVQTFQETPPQSAQIVKTLGDNYLASIGRTAMTVTVEGYLLQAENFQWLTEWRSNFDLYLSADQCILRRAQAYLTIGNVLYVGYILQTNLSRSAQGSWQLVQFGFSMMITRVQDLHLVKVEDEAGQAVWAPSLAATIRVGEPGEASWEESVRITRNAELLRGGAGEDQFVFDFAKNEVTPMNEYEWAHASGEAVRVSFAPATEDGTPRLQMPTIGLADETEEVLGAPLIESWQEGVPIDLDSVSSPTVLV